MSNHEDCLVTVRHGDLIKIDPYVPINKHDIFKVDDNYYLDIVKKSLNKLL